MLSPVRLTIAFGPSRSKFFRRAVAHARATAAEITEPELGHFRATYALGIDPDPYAHAASRGREFGVKIES